MTTLKPAWVPHQIIALAVLTLPASHRERYRRELNAELHFIPRAGQLRYATQVLSRTWSLRAALHDPAPALIGANTMNVPTRPLRCRLSLWHQWSTHFTEDGGRYQACARCGKEAPLPRIGKNIYFPWSG